MYVCTPARMYARAWLCNGICLYSCIYNARKSEARRTCAQDELLWRATLNTHVHACTHTHTYVQGMILWISRHDIYIYIYIYIHIHIYIYIYIHTHIYIYTHTHIHTHTHMRTQQEHTREKKTAQTFSAYSMSQRISPRRTHDNAITQPDIKKNIKIWIKKLCLFSHEFLLCPQMALAVVVLSD